MSKPIDSPKKHVHLMQSVDESFVLVKNMRPIPVSAINRFREEVSFSNAYNATALKGTR